MQTGEDLTALRKILEMTRLFSLFVLAIHFYICLYPAFQGWNWTAGITDRIVANIARTGLFDSLMKPKLFALLLLLISLVGAKGRKEEKIDVKRQLLLIGCGLILYLLSGLAFHMSDQADTIAVVYMGLALTGYLLVLTGGVRLSRLLKVKLDKDIFNKDNETFPQQEELQENNYSINLPTEYNLKGQVRKGWINIINPFRGLLVSGTPGAGKSYFIIRHVITQHIKKGFTLFLYDFKYDDLTRIAYNTLLNNLAAYAVKPKFYVINFDDLSRTHRCNPLEPSGMEDISDATEASRTIMLGLNRDWIKKQGDFFVESPINFLTAIIWYLKKYQDGRYCTLPHVIELMQRDYKELFEVIRLEKEIEVLINPFISAFQNNATDQLEGQIASAKIGLARLSSPQLYYVLSGNDFTLDVNNPKAPKLVCVGNNPAKLQTYGAVISLFFSKAMKLVNRKSQLPCSVIADEFPTIYFNNPETVIATGRSNLIATTFAIQDNSQLKKDYGREQAEVIMNIPGNVISGQVSGDTARQFSERIGKIVQERQSISINSDDTSTSKSSQLDFAVPAAKIAALSSGEFVGMVADDPDNRVELKAFHGRVINNHAALKLEEANYKPLPIIKEVNEETIEGVYQKIKREIAALVEDELARQKKIQEALGNGQKEAEEKQETGQKRQSKKRSRPISH
jgi:hypothetical protein